MFLLTRCLLAVAIGANILLLISTESVSARDVRSTLAVVSQPALDRVAEESDEDSDNEPDPADEADEEKDTKSDDDESSDKKDEGSSEKKADSDKADEKSTDSDEKDADDKESKTESEKSSDDKEKPKSAEPKKEDKPKPFTVKEKQLKIEQTLEGIFVAEDMEEVALRPDVWSRYSVVEAVEHGKEVKKGDVLVKFDTEDIEERLAEETIDQRLSELALMQAEEEAPRDERLLKLAYESARRTYDQLVEDHKYYVETDRPFAERIAKYRYDSSKEDLASQEEELTQLKKMYEADEITEETEKIVLRRQEFEVQTAKLMLELQTASRDYTLNVSLPRNDLYYKTMLEETKLAMEEAKTAMELGTTRSKYDMEKKRAARTRSLQNNAKLLADRELMEIKAPTDGVVYYGRCVSGQWAEIGSMTAKLVPHSMIPPNTVLMTIVKQRPLYVLSSVGEKEFPDFKEGMAATLKPVAGGGEEELDAKITTLSAVPGGGKKFELRVDLDKDELPEWLVAGMSCAVEVTTYDKKDALMVPAELINTDEDNDKIKYVMVVEDDEEEPVRREVKLGKTKDKQVEIVSGLEEGDKIVKEEPKKDDESK
jgi:multidrug efflux pump subunit AcrA (membrane-fusion protein)